MFINGLLVAVKQAELGRDGSKAGGLLFSDNFVGVTESGEQLTMRKHLRIWVLVTQCCDVAVHNKHNAHF